MTESRMWKRKPPTLTKSKKKKRRTQQTPRRPEPSESEVEQFLKETIINVIVNVPPADDEQVARVPKTGEQGQRRAQAG